MVESDVEAGRADAPPEPEPSATLLLVRDGPGGLEVLMVERHPAVDFVPGAMVFPGGKLDTPDRDAALHRRCTGVEGLDGDAVAMRVAAIREAFEECGVLLARPRGRRALLAGEHLSAIAARHREALHEGRTTLLEMTEREDLELACDLPVHFAHWVTPEILPRRFDTHFFLVAAPPEQVAVHDGRESVDSVWISPARALAEEAAGRLVIIFPTLLNLQKLGRSASVREAVEAARRDRVVRVLPWVEKGAQGLVVRIPADAGYETREAPVERMALPKNLRRR